MRQRRVLGITLALVSWLPAVAAAGELTGAWEVMTLGGDRQVTIWQRGDELTVLRVMFPEFEGERYKLEHLFRGRLDGNRVEGRLFVREEGMRQFDELRAFVGRLESDGKLLLDGLPLKKVGDDPGGTPPRLRPPRRRGRRAPGLSVRAIERQPIASVCFRPWEILS